MADEVKMIRISGTDALGAKLVPMLVEAYKKEGNDDVAFEIRGEGSSQALRDLSEGMADIGMALRSVRSDETAVLKLKEIPACEDMVAVVVNEANPVRNLTRKQVSSIFTGDVKDWQELGGKLGRIVVYCQNARSANDEAWKVMAMDGRDYVGSGVKLAVSDPPLAKVAGDVNGITCIGTAYARKKGIVAVAVDGLMPVPENVGRYPYVNRYQWVLPVPERPEVGKFMAFVRGGKGREIIEKVGFFPE